MSDFTKKFRLPSIDILGLFRKKKKSNPKSYLKPLSSGESGPGYPNRDTIKVYINYEDFRIPKPQDTVSISVVYSSRPELFTDALKVWQPELAKAGKVFEIVTVKERADFAGIFWKEMNRNNAGELDNKVVPPTIYSAYHSYFLDYNDLLANAIHEIGHGLGLNHSNDENDVMHLYSKVTVLSESDKESVKELFARKG